MYNQRKWYRQPLAVILIGSVFILTACKPTNKLASAGSTQQAPVKTSVPAPLSTQVSTPAVTPTPYILAGATTTASGLQYLEEKAGDGPSPKAGDVIKMNYSVSLPDGTQIYNTFTTNEPVTAVWGRAQLLPGWEEGVGMMKAGGKSRFVIPPDLALGTQGTSLIPPNSQLVMEVELLSVGPAPVPDTVSADQMKTEASGLQYADLVVGSGTEAISSTTVTTEFSVWVKGASSNDFVTSSDGKPVTFVVGKGDSVFPGWDQGVVGMKVGGKRLLVIPPDLALGAQGSGSIPANSTLIMEITLTDVKEPKKATKVDEKDYITTPSGLKYYDIKVGTGITPTVGQTVVVNYVGWLEDGTQFDSSYDRGQPFSFVLGKGNVIQGWDIGVAGMKVGGIRQLVIPASLGYGNSGAGSTIPPGATLIFEVELLEIKP